MIKNILKISTLTSLAAITAVSVAQAREPHSHAYKANITTSSPIELKLNILICSHVPGEAETCKSETKTLSVDDGLSYQLKAYDRLSIVRAVGDDETYGHVHRVWNPASESCEANGDGPYQQILNLSPDTQTGLVTCEVK
ncbi:MAG: hypothetical protein CMF50_05245 [Legionellales bacterium]|nr:hypothetical protein [Legionellales bacterium]